MRFHCLTHQYLELNALVDEFGERNFTVLAYPTNHFGKQEPGANTEILNGIKYVRPGGGYVPNFPIFEKGDVNGAKAQEIWKYLKETCKSPEEKLGSASRLHWDPFHNDDIRWTFLDRFIINTEGFPYIRINDHRSLDTPGGLRDDIDQFLRDGDIDL
ncbi:glutathione peroxidase 3-like [Glandiceps talaboti]